jgi:hypothetical protein
MGLAARLALVSGRWSREAERALVFGVREPRGVVSYGGVISRGPAVLATAAALALVNLGLASLIAFVVSARGFVPLWVGVVLLVLGAVATALAVTLWRGYLNSLREH